MHKNENLKLKKNIEKKEINAAMFTLLKICEHQGDNNGKKKQMLV